MFLDLYIDYGNLLSCKINLVTEILNSKQQITRKDKILQIIIKKYSMHVSMKSIKFLFRMKSLWLKQIDREAVWCIPGEVEGVVDTEEGAVLDLADKVSITSLIFSWFKHIYLSWIAIQFLATYMNLIWFCFLELTSTGFICGNMVLIRVGLEPMVPGLWGRTSS
jgi:hypothetical protein